MSLRFRGSFPDVVQGVNLRCRLTNETRITGYWGLALSPTAHRFLIRGRLLYTWCAWDSLFIPELLGESARVESSCPQTKSRIHLTVTPRGVIDLDPAGAVVSLVTPDSNK